MISFEMTGDLGQDLLDRFGRWASVDPMNLANEIARIIREENREWLLRGIDAYGLPMEPVKPSTVKRGRGGGVKGRPDTRGGGGFGPPLVPRFGQSRLISGFQVEVMRYGGHSGYAVYAGWPGLDWVQYHQFGYHVGRASPAMVPARPVAGFRDSTNKQIEEAIDAECRRIMDGLEG